MPLRHPVCGRITYPLGLNPAGVSLFRTHAAQSSLRTDCGTFWHAFALLLAVSKMPLRHPCHWGAVHRADSVSMWRVRHFTTHSVFGHVFPLKVLCLLCIRNLFFCFFVIFLSCFRFRWNLGSAAWAVALLYNLYILYMYIVVPACCAFSAHFSPIACITNLVLVKLQHFKSCYVLQRRKHICKILRRMALDCGNVLGR